MTVSTYTQRQPTTASSSTSRVHSSVVDRDRQCEQCTTRILGESFTILSILGKMRY